MNAAPYRLNLLLAIQRAQAAGFRHFAAALVELLRKEDKGAAYSIPTFDRVNHDQTCQQIQPTPNR